ncbi:MAG: PIN domain-containing protein [Desulfonatronovibrio sp.]|nr:PIN domain-containing protein [Desulfovibrionales bacterium]
MKVVVDLNVLLDVVQKRDKFYFSSAVVLEAVVEKKVHGFIPAHLITTLYYLTARHSSKENADLLIQWILTHCEIGAESRQEFLTAIQLDFPDFEDAVVAGVAKSHQCEFIITRNIKDFKNSPVQAMTPEEFIVQFLQHNADGHVL